MYCFKKGNKINNITEQVCNTSYEISSINKQGIFPETLFLVFLRE